MGRIIRSAVDRPAQEPARAVIMKREFAPITIARHERSARALTMEAFLKLSTDTGVQHFLKLVMAGEVENPFSRAGWERVIEFQAVHDFPAMTRAQSVSKYLCTSLGTQLFQVTKASPVEVEKKQSLLADERLGTLTLEEARALGDPRIRPRTFPAPPTAPKGSGNRANVGIEGRGGPSGAEQNSKAVTRKTDADKERAMRQYLAGPGSWPAI
jgi:hypothetical protein